MKFLIQSLKDMMLGNIKDIQPISPNINETNATFEVLNLVFIVITLISLIVIVLQGVKYSLSGGNPEATNNARNGIIYALIGLVVAISAWNIVNFALGEVIPDNSNEVDQSTVIGLLSNIAGLIVIIGAIIAVIMIVVGGIRFVTSGGNSESASKARNTIIYALVGLAVSITAGPIIGTVLDRLS